MTKRNRLLAIIIALVLACLSLTGCEDVDHESKDIEEETEVIEYEDFAPLILITKAKIEGPGWYQYIYYNPETMVMYTHFTDISDHGLSEMHNPDGSLRLYDGKSEVKPLVFISKVKLEGADSNQYTFYDPETFVVYVHFTDMRDYAISEMHAADGTYLTYTPKPKKTEEN